MRIIFSHLIGGLSSAVLPQTVSSGSPAALDELTSSPPAQPADPVADTPHLAVTDV